jgi:hypothetical protein
MQDRRPDRLQRLPAGLQRRVQFAGSLPEPGHRHIGVPVAAERKMHFSPVLFHKGLDPESGGVPEARTNPKNTEKVFHDGMPLGSTPTEL